MSGQKPSGESVFSFLGNLLIAFGIMLVILVAGALGGGGGSGGRAGDAAFFMVVLALPVLLVVAIVAMIFKAIGAVTRKETSGDLASAPRRRRPRARGRAASIDGMGEIDGMKRLLPIMGFLAPLAGQAHAASTCPPEIAVRENLATEVPGWRAVFGEPRRRLNRIAFHDGHPSERVTLVPDATTKAGGRETATWRFGQDSGRGIWMECGYAGTSISLVRELPTETKACSVTYDARVRLGGMPRIEGVECR